MTQLHACPYFVVQGSATRDACGLQLVIETVSNSTFYYGCGLLLVIETVPNSTFCCACGLLLVVEVVAALAVAPALDAAGAEGKAGVEHPVARSEPAGGGWSEVERAGGLRGDETSSTEAKARALQR